MYTWIIYHLVIVILVRPSRSSSITAARTRAVKLSADWPLTALFHTAWQDITEFMVAAGDKHKQKYTKWKEFGIIINAQCYCNNDLVFIFLLSSRRTFFYSTRNEGFTPPLSEGSSKSSPNSNQIKSRLWNTFCFFLIVLLF